MRARPFGAVAFAVALSAHAVDAAAPPARQIRLSWVRDDGAASCPDARVIEARTRAWLGRDPFADDAPSAVEVTVGRQGEALVARIRIRADDGSPSGQRQITSEDCDTLASAVALALAIHVDPDVIVGGTPPVPRSPPRPPEPPRSDTVTPAPARSAEGSIAVGALVASGLLPSAAPGIRVAAGLALGPRWRVVVSGAMLPARETAGGPLAFGLAAAGAGACFALLEGRVGRLGPCAELHGGEFHALVYTLEAVPPGTRFWAGESTMARFELRALAPFSIALGAGVVLPATRPHFKVEGHSETAFREDAIAPLADLTVGLTFP